MRRELSAAERRSWLRLARTPHVGPVTFQALMERYQDAEAALDALPALAKRGGRVDPMRIPGPDDIERELDAVDRMSGRMIAAIEPNFPDALAALDPPPPVITVLGDADMAARDCVSIVGSRNASAIGLRMAGDFARGLGEAGLVIVSGMARGIDSAAHAAAIETGTVAVLAGGVDHIYPREAEALYDDIRQRGGIISEQPLGYRATARDFPRRNRLVSGLSLGVIVVEAAKRSGSLITARLAGEQGREVMAVPGSPLDPRAAGANGLIKQGAALIQNAEEALEMIRDLPRLSLQEPEANYGDKPMDEDALTRAADDARDHVLSLISTAPTHRDEVARQAGLPPTVVFAALVELELAGRVSLEPGGAVRLT